VESQGKVGIQTQKKREMSGIPREARDPNSKEDEGTSQGGSPKLHPIFVADPTEIVIQVRGWYERGRGRPQPGLKNDMVMSDPEEEW
jgi:hypothetical protein